MANLFTFDESAPFEFEDPNKNRHLLLAGEAFVGLQYLLLEARVSKGATWAARYRELLHRAETSLQRAIWESETDFSEGDHHNHPCILAKEQLKSIKAQAEGLENAKSGSVAPRLFEVPQTTEPASWQINTTPPTIS